ncbi:MGDG synthase family glycosyltransferase [Terrilactibacillus laevilacticus]|uniref:Glycosyltransferase n=1 Tax=Terrilactibacillus laevilacticus TaxID=1380157 RepID=A0ABW5PP78_9BACI|nr:glycosyltransferase [Terrilactibacillus laevilacticus]
MAYEDKNKILILSATIGDGHKQVAKAISEAVEYTLSNTETITIDIMEWIHPYLYPLSNYVYKRSIKKFPQIYSYLYRKTRVKSVFSTKLISLFMLGIHSMLEIVHRVKPSIIVCTYPFAAGMISKLKEQGLIDIPSVTVITDYTDHSYWIHPLTDQYIVGSSQVKDRLISAGVEPYKINITGIPIRKRFFETPTREQLIKKFDINSDKFTILIMGGGDGFFGKGVSTFQALESISPSVQLIIVCGRNKKLKKRLEQDCINFKHDVLLMGYCENIHELMAMSDLIITKPGGVTTSEALAMELPLLIYKPLPGQEEDNARFLLESRLALVAKDQNELINKIQSLLDDSESLVFMKQRIKQYSTKISSLEAINVIVHAINQKENQKIG